WHIRGETRGPSDPAPAAASAPTRRCRDKRVDCRGSARRGWESLRGSCRDRRSLYGPRGATPPGPRPLRTGNDVARTAPHALAVTCRREVDQVLLTEQPAVHDALQGLVERRILNRIKQLRDEATHQHGFGLRLGNATAEQIEEAIFIELAAGRTVSADDVVGVDFEFRLGKDFRLIREHEPLMHELCIGLLRVASNDQLALNNGARSALGDRLE